MENKVTGIFIFQRWARTMPEWQPPKENSKAEMYTEASEAIVEPTWAFAMDWKWNEVFAYIQAEIIQNLEMYFGQ